MRVILAISDADQLAQLVQDNPDTPIALEVREPTGEGGTVYLHLAGVEFQGKVRRTPSREGSFRVEDLDGRIVFDG